MKEKRSKRKEKVGVVVSNKCNKTIIVKVERLAKHAKYGKVIKKSKKFMTHDEEGKAKPGDKVRIVETRPLSKLKRWRLVEVIK